MPGDSVVVPSGAPVPLSRRSVLRACTVTAALPLLSGAASARSGRAAVSGRDAGPFVYWHWPNGNITRDGLSRDLAAMHAMGIRGAYIHNVAVGIPRGPIDYGSPAWVALLRHALDEAKRLGIVLILHHAAGYSGTGAAWVTPQQSQQQLVWSEARAEGDTPIFLPTPYRKLDWYRDIAVLAYPAAEQENALFHDVVDNVVDNRGETVDIRALHGPDPTHRCRIAPDDTGTASLTIRLKHPFAACSLTLYRSPEEPLDPFDGPRDYPPRFTLEVSEDGESYHEVCQFEAPPLRALESPAVATFPLVQGGYYRLRADGPSWITGFSLHGSARLPDWPVKANAAAGTPDGMTIHGHDAIGIDPATVLDLTAHLRPDGRLAWSPPPGRWTILRLGHTATGEHLAATPDSAHALNIDMFDAQMVDRLFAQSLDPLLAQLGNHVGDTMPALQMDSFEAGRQNWTADFPLHFQQHRGYALGAWLLTMTGRIVGDSNRSERALFDIRAVQSALMIRDYFGRMRDRCNRRGLVLAAETYGDGAYDALEAAGAVDLAMCEFWARHTYGADTRTQLAVSTEHGRGGALVAAEAFTGEPRTSRYTEHPFALKAQGDRMTALGVTQLVLHSFVHQPHPTAKPGMTMGPFGTHFDRNQSWSGMADAWTGYVARCHALLRQGRPTVDIACFKGEDIAGNSPDVRMPPFSIPSGYAADVIDTATLHRLTPRAKWAVNGANLGYRCIVLPPMRAASVATMQALVRLAQGGVAVLALTLPARAIDAAQDSHADAAVVALSAQLSRLSAATLGEALARAGIVPDMTLVSASPSAAIHAIRREMEGGPVWFIGNDRRRPESVTVRLPVVGEASLWWPETGETSPAVIVPGPKGMSDVTLSLPPSGSVFVRFDRPAPLLSSISRNGQNLSAPAAIMDDSGRHGDFTIMLWAKPETFMLPGRGFLFYPDEGGARFGQGHVSIGLAAGRNGLTLFERGVGSPVPILDIAQPLAGWTHIALVYDSGRPTLYIDGKLAGQGDARTAHVHPGLWTPTSYPQVRLRFEGDQTAHELTWAALPATAIKAAAAQGLPEPALRDLISLSLGTDGRMTALARADGLYRIETPGRPPMTFQASDAHFDKLDGPWEVAFDQGHGGPASIRLDSLASLSRHPDPAVAHFSGTAQYRRVVDLPPLAQGQRLLLDLGRVECMARVVVNGQTLKTCWAPPHEIDISQAIRPGHNAIEIAVACLWPNRLIADAQLEGPRRFGAAGQIFDLPPWYRDGQPMPPGPASFTTWRHYKGDEPLLDTGLLGPVRLIWAATGTIA